MSTRTLEERLLSRVVKTESCWLWQGPPRKRNGYGGIQVNGKSVLVHRLSYSLFVGPLLPGECVLHSCDNDLCINPAHLFIGDREDNNRDRATKKRSATGERVASSKLTTDDVRRIRLSEGFSVTELSRQFHVYPQTISKILSRETWKHT